MIQLDPFTTIAEIAITITGFTAIAAVVGRRVGERWGAGEILQFMVLIRTSVIVVFISFAPAVFSQVLDGPEAERTGLAYRSVPDDELLEFTHEFARGAASAPRELAIMTKQTIRDMADIDEHPAAVEREFDPQLWTVQQPWFEERIAALKAKISSRKG